MGTHHEQLTPEERATIMLMTSQQWSARHIARTLHRSASTTRAKLVQAAKDAGIALKQTHAKEPSSTARLVATHTHASSNA